MQDIIISGGGIGGLMAAIGLARRGRRSIVLERAPEFLEIGAGIQLGPNAFRCFDALGIGSQTRELAIHIDELRLMDAVTGKLIVGLPLQEAFLGRFHNPYAVVHRGELHSLLVRACEESSLIDLRPSCVVKSYEETDQAVTVKLEDGRTIQGSGLVGADGLWSTVRSRLIGDGPPRVSGHTTYRAVIRAEDMPEPLRWNAATLWAGPRCHIVHYPLSNWKMFNVVATFQNEAGEPTAGEPVSPEEVAEGFADLNADARSVIASGREWKKWVLCDREPIDRWSFGRVTLLGDAAHPMMQYLAQGACMAMEDAVVIADEIDRHGSDITGAFSAYETRRLTRTARVQMMSREIGKYIYHPLGVMATLRNEMMRAKSTEDWYDNLDWLYSEPESATSSEVSAVAA